MTEQNNYVSNITLTPRYYKHFNRQGFFSLCRKETLRFLNVYLQTVVAPVITSLLLLAVFSLALGRRVDVFPGVSFVEFLAPGLIMMGMAQNAFANTSSSLVAAKIQRNIVDVLLAPISTSEFLVAYIIGGIIRGALVGILTFIGIMFFVPLPIANIGWILSFAILGSMMMALLGILGGIWSEKFDHMAAVNNFFIMPFTFLSGTFYSIHRLPEFFFNLTKINPFFYMIDGFRSGFIGVGDSSPWVGCAVLTFVNMLLILAAYKLIDKGYKLKQ